MFMIVGHLMSSQARSPSSLEYFSFCLLMLAVVSRVPSTLMFGPIDAGKSCYR